MKITKLSLIAALAVTTAMAGDAKISGDAKLYYGTDDSGTNDFFEQGGSIGDVALNLDYSREVGNGVTLNFGIAGISTLGLENELVAGTWITHGTKTTVPVLDATGAATGDTAGTTGNPVGDAVWIDTANIVVNMGKTTAVVGRQTLDTPFFKTETWNIAQNTFDAAVLVNSNVPDTTLVGAWVGRGNGTAGSTVNLNNDNLGGNHHGFGGDHPAYAVGAINKSIPLTTVQAWGYRIPKVATAYWTQADIAATKEISVGLQYAAAELNAGSANVDTSAYATQIAYNAGKLSTSVAYSKRDNKEGGIDISNIATGHTQGSESSLYTESYWNLGFVGAQGAEAVAAKVAYDLGAAQVALQGTSSHASQAQGANDLQEVAATVSTKVGPLNVDLAYINAHIDNARTDTALVMLTAPFSL